MKQFLLLLLLPLTALAQAPSRKIKVLFIGNSYTYVNNLPALIQNMALANGDTLVYDENTIGGFSLGNHFYNATTLTKINTPGWDYVVLQAQSQEPAFPASYVNSQTLQYALKLDSAVHHANPCAITVFYETWGRKYGDASNCGQFPAMCTYTSMQNRLRESYLMFTDTTHAMMAPVGEAWRATIGAYPGIELYQTDESHPSLEGSYVAASVFYETLFHKSVLSNSFNPGVSVTNKTFLQQAAHNTVIDSLAVWHIYDPFPVAGFTSTLTGMTMQFTSQSQALNNVWYFGDGTTSTQNSPNHTYATSGNYVVSHVVTRGNCKRDSVQQLVQIPVTIGIAENNKETHFTLYPNPCRDVLQIVASPVFTEHTTRIEIFDVTGQLVFNSTYNSNLPVASLPPGIYTLRLYNNLATANARFVKNE